jgi:hypothetical protein
MRIGSLSHYTEVHRYIPILYRMRSTFEFMTTQQLPWTRDTPCICSQQYYQLSYTCIVSAEQELDVQIVQNFPRKCPVACQVSSARQYYKLKACLFWKRYRTLVASPTSSLGCSLDGLNEQVGQIVGLCRVSACRTCRSSSLVSTGKKD